MDHFLAQRSKDSRFQNERRVTGVVSNTPSWYQSESREHGLQYERGLVRTRHTFAEEKKKDSGSDSASSESDGEGGRKKKKKGRCWEGYEPTPGKEPYSDGSCQKK